MFHVRYGFIFGCMIVGVSLAAIMVACVSEGGQRQERGIASGSGRPGPGGAQGSGPMSGMNRPGRPGEGAQEGGADAGPQSAAVDSMGNLYFADSGNNRIRMVDKTGKISTVAGTGVRGYSGDGGFAVSARLSNPGGVAVDSSGNLYIVDTGNNRIRKVNAEGIIRAVID